MTDGYTQVMVDAHWTPVGPGVDRRLLRELPGGGSAYVLRFSSGAGFPSHAHPGGEDLYVLGGRVRLDGEVLSRGDYRWTAPGGVNTVQAELDSELLVVAPLAVAVALALAPRAEP